ncbi:MAG: hypothetical protein B6D63_02180 [Candidatus Latescibacteria bacterium 4484_7]|nr:MAG: hypothetical protein B6D63_02180 [Candidatus Latescibacteria bacterium 4484_7]
MTKGRYGHLLWAAVLFVFVSYLGCSRFETRLSSVRPFIHYRVSVSDLDLEVLRVEGDVQGVVRKETIFRPASNDEGGTIDPIGFKAEDLDGRALEVERSDEALKIKNDGKDFSFSYTVPVVVENRYSPDVRTMLTMIDTEHCRLVARDLFLLCDTDLADGIIIDLDIPDDWVLASSAISIRKRTVVEETGDFPLTTIVCGRMQSFDSSVDAVEVSMASIGKWRFEAERLFELVRRIASYEIDMFGGSPRAKFLVIVEPNPVKGGAGFDYYGIHLGGTMFLFLDPHMDGHMLFDAPMSVVAHELFHNWNGEALSPASNSFLWFTEGATVYYSYRVLEGTGIITPEQYKARRNVIYNRFVDNRYHGKVPIREAQNNDLGDKEMVNFFYDGGYLTCERLDAMIRSESKGRIKLIDVLRYLYNNRKPGQRVDEGLLVDAIKKLSGLDVSLALQKMLDDPSAEFFSKAPSSLD